MEGGQAAWPDLEDVHTIVFDFDGVFTDNKVYVSTDGIEFVRCDRADGLAIDFLRRHCARVGKELGLLIVSTERNPVVAARAAKLGLECRQAVGDKLACIEGYLAGRRLDAADPFDGLIYVGNDLNDLPVIDRSGFSVVPADAHPIVRQRAKAVLTQRGGDGFVRAVVERMLRVSDLRWEELYELVLDR